MGGDFNVVRNRSERSNCMGLLNGLKDFGRFIDKCKLVDLPLMGKNFTWYGSDNKSRLDRFFMDEEWLEHFEYLQHQGLKRSISDHILILLANEIVDWGLRPFKFINVWLSKKECSSLIKK